MPRSRRSSRNARPVTPGPPAALPASHRVVGGVYSSALSLQDISEAAKADTGTLWVHVDTTQSQQVDVLRKVFGFHPLTIEAVLSGDSRPSTESYDHYVFVALRVVELDTSTPDPYDLQTRNLYCFIGRHYLVTASAGISETVQRFSGLCERSSDIVERGPARLAHLLMDSGLETFFPMLDRIDEFIDSIEERVFSQFDRSSLRDIFEVKRLVLSLRRHLSPHREVFNVLSNRPSPILAPDVQLYFRDIHDQMLRIGEALDTYRDLLGSTMESYLSQVSNELNVVTKGLTVVATMSVPFVVVSGMWGMNFSDVPLSQHQWGFEILLGVQVAAGLALLWYLRRRRFT